MSSFRSSALFVDLLFLFLSNTLFLFCSCSVPIGTGAPFHIHSDALNLLLKGRKRCIANCMLLKLKLKKKTTLF